MIFSISSVCFAYVVGLTVATFYIRSLKLVGAGFFWMMNSTSLVISIFGFLASSGIVRIVSGMCMGACGLNWVVSIFLRTKMRERMKTVEFFAFLATVIFSIWVLVSSASRLDSRIDEILESIRLIVGGLLLGGVSTAMLLGHWYLVQPGLTRKPIGRMCKACIVLLCVDVAGWFFSPSMYRVFTGSVSDGWNGTLGYMWIGASITTFILLVFAYKALQEKSYSAVMATTGLLYLAILIANGVELIPRSIFSV